MADFTELPVDTEGVGTYHFNRFRIAFEPPRGSKNAAALLPAILYANFPTYINSNAATAEWGDHLYDQYKTIHFQGIAKFLGINLAAPHSDWVAIKWVDSNLAFTVQTLRREFFDTVEDGAPIVATSLINIVPVIPPPVIPLINIGGIGATANIPWNRRHFLAGRRGWRIGDGSVFGLSSKVIVLETVAVERFSSQEYNIADWIIGLETKVPDVWLAFLNNFVNMNGCNPIDQALKPNWTKAKRSMYVQLSFDSLDILRSNQEFIDAYKLFPNILP